MDYFVGLDVGVEDTALCVVDVDGVVFMWIYGLQEIKGGLGIGFTNPTLNRLEAHR